MRDYMPVPFSRDNAPGVEAFQRQGKLAERDAIEMQISDLVYAVRQLYGENQQGYVEWLSENSEEWSKYTQATTGEAE